MQDPSKDKDPQPSSTSDPDTGKREKKPTASAAPPAPDIPPPPHQLDDKHRYVSTPGDRNVRVTVDGVSRMSLEGAAPADVNEDSAAALNAVILNCTTGMRFVNYQRFIERVLCSTGELQKQVERDLRTSALEPNRLTSFSNRYAYELLKVATEAFLALQCTGFSELNITEDSTDPGVAALRRVNTIDEIKDALNRYLGPNRTLPYIDTIAPALVEQARQTRTFFCDVSPFSSFQPCCIELIKTYWLYLGGLNQTMNAISMRFENKRTGIGRNPLSALELEPLRPASHFLFGRKMDRHNRLTLEQIEYECRHQYGVTLLGHDAPRINPADVRSNFIRAFHNLLHVAALFYKEQANKFVVPDAFQLLNALKDVHLTLAEGAHNQFPDLAWTARVEMMIDQWILQRSEVQRFLGGRFMVPYPEPWMGVVDQMKTLQGWPNVSIRHFHELAEKSEQLILSIRWGDWSNVSSTLSAENWANIWRDAIYAYINSYRAVTGVDLSVTTNAVRLTEESYMQPAFLLRSRQALQRRT